MAESYRQVQIVDSGGNAVAIGSTPPGATMITATSGNVAAASAVATLAAAPGKTTYVTGINITGAGATAASIVTAVLSGLVTGSQSFTIAVPAGVTTAITPLHFAFTTPIPASAANTAIVLTVPSFGSGNTNVTANAQGYQL